jgi:hypothetical protein
MCLDISNKRLGRSTKIKVNLCFAISPQTPNTYRAPSRPLNISLKILRVDLKLNEIGPIIALIVRIVPEYTPNADRGTAN